MIFVMRFAITFATTFAIILAPGAVAQENSNKVPAFTAVGRLLVPAVRYEEGYPRHYDEHCSATLVAPDTSRASKLLVSAWHCLEDYRDLSRPLLFQRGNAPGHPVSVVVTGGSMDSDWALLRLDKPQADFQPLRAASNSPPNTLIMAGFPNDMPREETAALVRHCELIGRDGRDLRSNCVLKKGASGGAVIAPDGAGTFIGVISRGDSESQSIFVPVERFIDRIQPYF